MIPEEAAYPNHTATPISDLLYTQGVKHITERNRLQWWTAKEMSEYYHVNTSTIYHWMKRGYFPYVQDGGRKYVHVSTIDWIDKQGRKLVVEVKRLFPRLVYDAVSGGSLVFPSVKE